MNGLKREVQVTAGAMEMARAQGLGTAGRGWQIFRPGDIRCIEEKGKVRNRDKILEKTRGETGLDQRGKEKLVLCI